MATTKPKRAPARRNAAAHFKAGDRVRFKYGKREVEGTVTSTSGDRVHVEMHFSDEPVSGLFRENELRIA
ncbi:hypothetical protein [Nocardia lijiangensis]|uniref:hypothetical protein n=1 Tax=Nocardia lijiangensis TaxID=299618 RepID=UPI003D72DA7E